MKTDLYTKTILSIIALVLSLNLLAEFNFISKAYAKSENFIIPNYLSIPVNEDGSINVKLSKRDGDRLGFPVFPLRWEDPATKEVSSGYREKGYYPESFINMLAFLGWNPGTSKELYHM